MIIGSDASKEERFLCFLRATTKAWSRWGWSAQWTDPIDEAPFRYGGAVGPLELRQDSEILAGIAELAVALKIRGLASADFLDDGESLWLLEINPRPGATLDVFDDDTAPLIMRHLGALDGRRTTVPVIRNAKAAAIVYAKRDLIAPDGRWPDWAADLAPVGTAIAKDAPLCTVQAKGGTVAEAKTMLAERVHRLNEFVERTAG